MFTHKKNLVQLNPKIKVQILKSVYSYRPALEVGNEIADVNVAKLHLVEGTRLVWCLKDKIKCWWSM